MFAGMLEGHDCIVILHDRETGRYHPALYVESPLPGPPEPRSFVRLKSKMHHTTGFESLTEAQAEVDRMNTIFADKGWGTVPDSNRCLLPIAWSGWNDGEGAATWVLPDWIALDRTIGDFLETEPIGI